MRSSAVVIQSCLRRSLAQREGRRRRQEVLRAKLEELRRGEAERRGEWARGVLQRSLKSWVFRLKLARAIRRRTQAAVTIQAFWRGVRSRRAAKRVGGQAWGKLIEEVQTRLSAAHKNATEDKKLCNRFAHQRIFSLPNTPSHFAVLHKFCRCASE